MTIPRHNFCSHLRKKIVRMFCYHFPAFSVFLKTVTNPNNILQSCSVLWKPGSSRHPSWCGVLGKSEKGCWEFGMRGEWGGVEEGEVSLRVTWDQGGRDPITPRRVSKLVKGNGREAKGNWQGEQTRGLRHDHVVNLYTCI